MKKIIYSISFMIAGLTVVSCADEPVKSVKDNTTPISVATQKTSSAQTAGEVTASGSVEAVSHANLSTRSSGYVEKVLVKMGDPVKKGQLLVKINNADLSAKLAQKNSGVAEAKAAYNNAKKDYERYKALLKKNSATQKEFDDMQARFTMAKARLDAAKQMRDEVRSQFSYTDIKAPFTGIITRKNVQEGDLANPGQTLLSLEGKEGYQVKAMVPENQINTIKTDNDVAVTINSIDKTAKGKVTEISSSAQNSGGQYVVKVHLKNPSPDIKSGMYATVNFPVKDKAEVSGTGTVFVPKDAIVRKGQLTGVYTLSQKNTAILRWLRLGKTHDDKVEVLSGLDADETLILPSSTEAKLYNGVKISQK